MTDELASVSRVVVQVFMYFAEKYPDRLRYDLENKDLLWKDDCGNWNRVTDWDNF
jgi:hypothetical protein